MRRRRLMHAVDRKLSQLRRAAKKKRQRGDFGWWDSVAAVTRAMQPTLGGQLFKDSPLYALWNRIRREGYGGPR